MYQQYQQPGYPAQQPQAQPQQQYGVQYPGKQLCNSSSAVGPLLQCPTLSAAVPDPVGQVRVLSCPGACAPYGKWHRNCQEENTVAVYFVNL